jgi:hypothetical protein
VIGKNVQEFKNIWKILLYLLLELEYLEKLTRKTGIYRKLFL